MNTGAPDAVVVLVRHGRTSLNAAGSLRGRLDPPLDDVGEIEAVALGEALAGVGFDTVVTSPLTRARQTAQAIAGVSGARLEVDPDLVDRDYGPWTGSPAADVTRRFGSIEAAPDIEPAELFVSRCAAAVTAAAGRAGRIPLVVVAHDAVNRAVLQHLVPALGDGAGLSQRTGCWNRLERRGDVWWAPVIDAVPRRADQDPR
jgi:broad specificity phosphatase PhoE